MSFKHSIIKYRRFLLTCTIIIHAYTAFSQIYPVNAKLEDKKSFSMIVMPDPQSYIKFAANQPLFELQTAWIANNLDTLNIQGVLCTGDLVEQNDIAVPDYVNGDQTSQEQWQAVSNAFCRLDNKIPYILCTGNHDYGYKASEVRRTYFHEYFPAERNSCWKKTLVAIGNNYKGIPTLENAAYELTTDTWGKLLIISLEFSPRDEAIAWAKKIVNSPQYEKHKVILLTHSFLDYKGERFISEDYYPMRPANYPEAVWQKLVYPSTNIRLVICGHECHITDYDEQVSLRMDNNQNGKSIIQMMFNAQTADGQWHGNGGDCWLRILEFKPDGKTISVRTFSPLFALSPTTSQFAWRNKPFDQFDIVIN